MCLAPGCRPKDTGPAPEAGLGRGAGAGIPSPRTDGKQQQGPSDGAADDFVSSRAPEGPKTRGGGCCVSGLDLDGKTLEGAATVWDGGGDQIREPKPFVGARRKLRGSVVRGLTEAHCHKKKSTKRVGTVAY